MSEPNKIRERREHLEAKIADINTQRGPWMAQLDALQKVCNHTRMETNVFEGGMERTCPDCGYWETSF